MYLRRHSLQVILVAALFCLAVTPVLRAQNTCSSETNEIGWVVPPAIGGIEGDFELGEASTIYIGDRFGTMNVWSLTLGTLEPKSILTPGNGLPSEVVSIWDIKPLGNGVVVSLVSYSDGSAEWYGFIRSTDGGATWTLIAPESMKVDQFAVVEGKRVGGTGFTGNFWRVPLFEVEWLKDGLHGWAWGRKGIVRTSDGGLTWEVAYTTANTDNQTIGQIEAVWELTFKDADSGVAVMGPAFPQNYYTTVDGGKTWTKGQSLTLDRIISLDFIAGEYRALTFNRTVRFDNTYYYTSENGKTWKAGSGIHSVIKSESVYPTELIWANADVGFLVQREGEIWRTNNATNGNLWQLVQVDDPEYDTLLFGDGTSIAGNFQPPFFPRAAYNQRTILIRDDFGDPYLVNVVTDTCAGTVRPYIAVWSVDNFSSVGTTTRSASSLNLAVIPNPVRKECRVSFSLQKATDVKLLVVDATGTVVGNEEFRHQAEGKQEVGIDVSALPSGTYRVICRAGDEHSTYPFVIER